MLIGFTGAGGRTDASHAAILAARTFAIAGNGATLLVGGSPTSPAPIYDGALKVVRLASGRGGAANALRAGREACLGGDRVVVADIPAAWLNLEEVRSSLDMMIVVVGPHEADELEAAAFVERQGRQSLGRRFWYLGCRRSGGAPAASGFAEAMARIDRASSVLPVALPSLGRNEAAGLAGAVPAGRTLRIGLLLVAAIRQAAATPLSSRFTPLYTDTEDEARRIALSADTRSFPDRLRDLADDAEAAAAGFGPTEYDLAGAPVLDGWECDVVATPILKGRVTGHPNIPEGHRVQTSEVFLTDRATWARTLSRWYVLRAPSGSPGAALQ